MTFRALRVAAKFVAVGALLSCVIAPFAAYSQNDPSVHSEVSGIPVASVVGGSLGASEALPLVFSAAGATLVIKSVEASAKGMVYMVERISDGARASVEVSGKVADGVSTAVGTVIALIPNEIGQRPAGDAAVAQRCPA